MSELLDGLSDALWGRSIGIGEVTVFVPGVRLTMWLSAVIIMTAGVLAMISLRAGSGAFVRDAAVDAHAEQSVADVDRAES